MTEETPKEELETSTSAEPEANAESSSDSVADIKDHPEYLDLLGKYQRLLAEFENFRRRNARESLDLIEQANAKLIGKLTESLENIERAVEHVSEFDGKSYCDLQGILLTKDSFSKTLADFGLEVNDPVGQAFDPNLHEALMQQPSEEVPAEHVLNVFQKGYLVKGKVIRHAKVIVSTGPNA